MPTKWGKKINFVKEQKQTTNKKNGA